MRKKILVITDTLPWGHRSIARAIFNYLKTKEKELEIKVEYAEVKAETSIAGEAYNFAYRFAPSANRLAHKVISKSKTLRTMVVQFAALNLPRLTKLMNWHKPDLVISAYFLHSHSLEYWRQQEGKKFKLWTVIADPWSINPISFVPGADLNLVYDEKGVRMAGDYEVKPEKVSVTGWWVRPEMYQKYDRKVVRKRLGFIDDRPVIFVGGGSLGNNAIAKILPALLMVKSKVGLIFNTGTDKLAYNLVEEYTRLFHKIRKDDLVKIKNLGWIDNMAEILSACDIVFGKAGPNFLFDVVATEKPFVSITHIGGQEDGNIEIIRKKKLGWVKEKRQELVEFFLKYINNPDKYNHKYASTIRVEAEKNSLTMGKIAKMIGELEIDK